MECHCLLRIIRQVVRTPTTTSIDSPPPLPRALSNICTIIIVGSKGGSFTPPLPRALSNTFLKMSQRDGSKSPTVSINREHCGSEVSCWTAID